MTGMRIRAFAAAAVLLLAFARPAEADSGEWLALADRAYAESVEAVAAADAAGTYVRAQFVASLASYSGQRFGWRDRRTQAWLRRLASLRTPTGGYGLGTPYDAFGDGSVNPAGTAYTITEAWHVGRVLLAGYDGGGVPAGAVRHVARLVAGAPSSAGGRCPAYSDHPNDTGRPCVWNVSAAAGWFLEQAHARGLAGRTPARGWLARVRAAYRADLGGWTYQADTAVLQDSWHNAPIVAAMVETDPAFGREVLAAHFAHWPAGGANADLLPYDCSKADANFAAIRASATQPAGTPLLVLQTRAGYASALPAVARVCGVIGPGSGEGPGHSAGVAG
ncbi:hypothetical protein ILP97_40110 [Amycolatopsis sp. H6(2020)]|nr:hypothetical protein [Amycolatopsis sp. H6(2020)]